MEKKFDLKIGKGKMSISIPEEKLVHNIVGNEYPAIKDLEAAVIEAMENPIDSKPLKEIVKPGQKIVLVVSDVTRVWLKMSQFLPTIVNQLNAYGIPDENISILIAQGSHRAHTPAEDLLVCGQEIVNRIKIYQHDCKDESQLTYLGDTSRGTPVYINKRACEADHVILTGGIVYHLMAGFGGGRKSVMPGISGNTTIQKNHCIALAPVAGQGANPLCESGKLTGNPLNEDMVEAAAKLNPSFSINFVYTSSGEFAQVVAGHCHTSWVKGCETVAKVFGVDIQEKADLVIATAGGFPKDINLYQGSKTVDNAFFACKEKGTIIFMLDCPDINEPKEFTEWLRYDDILEFENAVRADFSIPAFIAFKTKQTGKLFNCIAVTTIESNYPVFEKVGFKPVATLAEAYELAKQSLPENFTVTIMSQGANTLPIMK